MCEGSLAVAPPTVAAAIVAEEVRRLVREGMTPAEALVSAVALLHAEPR